MTLDDNINELNEIMKILKENHDSFYVKLYVSCINYCPIVGKLNNDDIVNKLLKLYELKINSICLSDTCGTLNTEDFEYIVDKCANLGIPYNIFSLHLHVGNNREDIVEKIIHKALDRKIINFDVSLLKSGGCSITINKDNLCPNLSYELYYRSLINYIEKNINNY